MSLLTTEVIHGELRNNGKELYLTAFLGRGDYFNKKGICISNDSIPTCGPRWIDTPHVITQYKDHILYVKPKDMVFNSNREYADFLKLQALPHMTGKYVDWFYTTDNRGIHNIYGTSRQKDPIAIQSWKEGTFPRYTSTSLFAYARNARGMITDWEPIDNTSVDEDPAYGIELARITGDCECDASNGNACIVELRDKVRSADNQLEILQSAVDHSKKCRQQAFKDIKNRFEADNVHYQFLVQSALMSMNNNATSQEGSGASNNANPPAGSQSKTETSEGENSHVEITKSPTKEELTNSFNADFLSKTLGKKKEEAAKEGNVSNKTNEAEGAEQKKTEEKSKEEEQKTEAQPETLESVKSELAKAKKELAKANKTNDDNVAELLKFKEKTEARERGLMVKELVSTFGKDKLSDKRQDELIEYYTTDKDLAKIPDKKLAELIKVQLSLQQQVITETAKVKQSSMFGMTSKFIAKNDKEESDDGKHEYIDVAKLGGYLS